MAFGKGKLTWLLEKVNYLNARIVEFQRLDTFGTMKTCSTQGQFELVGVNHSTMSGGKIGISFRFSLT